MQKKNPKWRKFEPYLFCLPFLISFVIFKFYPALYTLYLSFTSFDGDSDPVWVGLKNYQRLVHDATFYKSITNTSIIWFFNFFPQLLLSMVLASIFTYCKIKGVVFYRAIFYFPNLIAAASVTMLFLMLLDTEHGTVNIFLKNIGIIKTNIDWLETPVGARGTVAFIQWWMWFGNSTIICLTGMTAISKDYYDCARVEGANAWQIFWRITTPLLQPTLLYILVTSLIGGTQIFDVPYLLTGTGPSNSTITMAMDVYNQAFRYSHFGYSSAISWGIFIIVGVLTVVVFKFLKPSYKNL